MPTSTAESWSFDGQNTTTKTILTDTYNVSISETVGRLVLAQTEAQSFSSDDTVAGSFDDHWGSADYGGGSVGNAIANVQGNWSTSDVTTYYDQSYDDKTGRVLNVAPYALGTSLQYEANALSGSRRVQRIPIGSGLQQRHLGKYRTAE